MAQPRTRGRKRTTAVGAKAPAAVASPPAARALDDQTFAEREDGLDRDDGSDLMVKAGDLIVATAAASREPGDEIEDGLVDETASQFTWSVPDSTPRLRRTAPQIDTTTSTAPFVPTLDVVATDPPPETLRPAAAAETRVIAIRKHRSGETVEPAGPPPIATQTTVPDGETTTPEFLRPRVGGDVADRDAFDARRVGQGVDPLTQRLGCRWFVDAARFEWCREGPFNLNPVGELDSRPRYVFTRWYQMDRIIVDVFRNDNDRVRHEIAEKIVSIKVQAHVEGHAIGYLPIVKGAFVPDAVLAAVKRGEIVPLQLAPIRRDEPVVAVFG